MKRQRFRPLSRRFRRLFGPALLLCLPWLAAPRGALAAACAEGQSLTLLHFNDYHGQLEAYADPETGARRGGIARLARAVDAARAEDPARPVLLLFAGDLLQGTLTSSLLFGLPDVRLFERLGVAAAAVGNHEFDYGQPAFRRLAEAASFPFLTANVQSHPEPLPVRERLRLELPGAPPIDILGLTTPELATATHPRNLYGIAVEDPLHAVERLLPATDPRPGLTVVLSHLGLDADRRLARARPDIDLIVGGHNHHRLSAPVMEGPVAILQAGERGGWLGRLDLDCENGELVRAGYRLLSLDAAQDEDPAVAAEVAAIVADAERSLGEIAGTAAVDLSAEREIVRRRESAFGNLIGDLAREITGAELALFNGGGFRASIPAGPVTLRQVHEAFPFRNELTVGRLRGDRLLAALEQSAALDPDNNPGGFLQVSGLSYRIADGRLAGARLADGTPIDPARRYLVVTNDFLAAGGDGYRMLAELEDPVMTGRLIGDMLIEALRAGQPLGAPVEGRIQRSERIDDRVLMLPHRIFQ